MNFRIKKNSNKKKKTTITEDITPFLGLRNVFNAKIYYLLSQVFVLQQVCLMRYILQFFKLFFLLIDLFNAFQGIFQYLFLLLNYL